ncbi:nucleotidyltransferase family protein [Mycetohabitans sp. B2]|nr:nucleotidyltransferase family protein [Mycetohabitans sp. B2]MCF7697128.1 nucleotidyltransferase family protein [Mycetohabitans sp. B2]
MIAAWEKPVKPSEALSRHREEIRRIVVANRATNPRVFGSVARGEDEDGSDLDILVDPTPDTSLLDIGGIQYKLQDLLGVPVDVLTPKAISIKFRDDVLAQAVPV